VTGPVVGLIGTGGMGRTHLAALRSIGVPVLVHGRRGAEALAAELGGEPVEDLDELLRRCAVVDIVTPTPSHLPIAFAALEAGRDVICEKPLARTAADAAALETAAVTAGRWLLPAQVVRYDPAYAALRAAIEAGELGALTGLRLHRSGERPATPWFADAAQSGGLVLDLLVHELDLARWIAGEVVELRARRRDEPGALESVEVELRHANGVSSRIDGAWREPGSPFLAEFEASGTAGARRGSTADEAAVGMPSTSPYELELGDFLRVIEHGGEPRVTARDGVEAVRLAEAVAASIERDAPVAVSPRRRAGIR